MTSRCEGAKMISKDVTFCDQGCEDRLPIAGLTVDEAKTQLRGVLNIPYFSDPFVNDKIVSLNRVLGDGDRLEFRKRYGVKGGDDQPFEQREAKGLFDAYELVRIADDVKRRNLPMEEGVTLAMLKFSQWAVERFGKPDPSAQKVLAQVEKLLEGTMRSDEPKLCPYRFQRVGVIWHIHFPVNGNVRKTEMRDSASLRQMGYLLRHPDHPVPYEVLSGHDDFESQVIIASEKNLRPERLLPGITVEQIQAARATLLIEMEAAKECGDEDRKHNAQQRLAKFDETMGTDEEHYQRFLRKTEDVKSLMTTCRKSVCKNRERLLKALSSEKHDMSECATFLEKHVRPEGNALVYRPPLSPPEWSN